MQMAMMLNPQDHEDDDLEAELEKNITEEPKERKLKKQ